MHACLLQPGDELLTNNTSTSCVKHIIEIFEPIELHTLTCDRHHFAVSEAHIITHNADAATVALAIGYITTINPIVATIGATFALSSSCVMLYYAYKQLQQHNSLAAEQRYINGPPLFSYESVVLPIEMANALVLQLSKMHSLKMA